LMQRLAHVRIVAKERAEKYIAPALDDLIERHRAMSAEGSTSPAALRQLETEIRNFDAQALILRRLPEVIASILYRYYRLGYDSTTIAKTLPLSPCGVRQVLARTSCQYKEQVARDAERDREREEGSPAAFVRKLSKPRRKFATEEERKEANRVTCRTYYRSLHPQYRRRRHFDTDEQRREALLERSHSPERLAQSRDHYHAKKLGITISTYREAKTVA
jgi:hypothetical protein